MKAGGSGSLSLEFVKFMPFKQGLELFPLVDSHPLRVSFSFKNKDYSTKV